MSHTVVGGIDYGPLAMLIGTWSGDKGVNLSAEPDGDERSQYFETIVFETAGDVTNAEEQVLAVVRYHQVVSRKSNDEVFHDQVGYWCWDSSDDTISESFVIPRAVAVVAGGKHAAPASADEHIVLAVEALAGADNFGIAQAEFMLNKARTTRFTHTLEVRGDQMQYSETTYLDIYGKQAYEHRDFNTLQRVQLPS